jgi:hypothetical protein
LDFNLLHNALVPGLSALADGGYFSREISRSVTVSADQRAIIIKNGDEISMTFSTGYTGEGEDFGWIIPTPVPPDIEDVSEAETGEEAFEILDEYTAPIVEISGCGCFPSGTEVLTASGPCPIEAVEPGTEVYGCDLATGECILTKVFKRQSHQYDGDMITIQMGNITIQATGNHPFYVLKGDRLAFRPIPRDIPKEEQGITEHGRWVEARDLREGDVLKDKSGVVLIITGVSGRNENTEVYNLDVEGCHNYTVHQRGILVHNKAKEGEVAESKLLVAVYGTITLFVYTESTVTSSNFPTATL